MKWVRSDIHRVWARSNSVALSPVLQHFDSIHRRPPINSIVHPLPWGLHPSHPHPPEKKMHQDLPLTRTVSVFWCWLGYLSSFSLLITQVYFIIWESCRLCLPKNLISEVCPSKFSFTYSIWKRLGLYCVSVRWWDNSRHSGRFATDQGKREKRSRRETKPLTNRHVP